MILSCHVCEFIKEHMLTGKHCGTCIKLSNFKWDEKKHFDIYGFTSDKLPLMKVEKQELDVKIQEVEKIIKKVKIKIPKSEKSKKKKQEYDKIWG